ncbi:MAG: ABC transporter permease [Rhodospirillales bacterium]|nr:ABC transporter permease [Rhodospirillales bacterium]
MNPQAATHNRWSPSLSANRILAMILRYIYLLKDSWPRILEMVYWPTVQLLMWGFISQYLASTTDLFAQAFGLFLAAVLLWDVLFRGQLGVSLSFFEEMWSRNLGHLMVSPLRPFEFIVALLTMSLIRTLIGMVPASLLTIWFFGYSVYDLGLSLVFFFINLIVMGWSFGIAVSGLVLRWGLGAESLAWALVFAIAPLCGVYYPLDVLPAWLLPIAHAIPASYVFEGMRAIILHDTVRWDLMLIATSLNGIYLTGGIGLFYAYFRAARRRGALLQMGE